MVNKYYQKHKEKLKKKHVKDIKIFLKKKKMKGEKRSEIDIKILQKRKKYESIWKKYYLVHNYLAHNY